MLVSINAIYCHCDVGGSSTTRKKRGPSQGKGLNIPLENGERIPISFTEEEGRPLCAYSSKFSSEIGVVVRLFTLIQFESWGVIPDDIK